MTENAHNLKHSHLPAGALLALCALSLGSGARAQQSAGEGRESVRFEMEEVVVTATRAAETVERLPRNVTVITAEDIEQAPSSNVVDLLAREAGLNLLSYYGQDKTARVDIRGMGETSHSNVIVMVDGFRLNTPDLAGPDFSLVPLDQIERIEVLRGAGSVVYGDGAVGGVINIITKKGTRKSEGVAHASYGSYDTLDTRLSYRGSSGNIGYSVQGSYYDSDGYRDNGYLRAKDAAGNLAWEATDRLTLSIAASYHEDDRGFPGFVGADAADDEHLRTGTKTPNDGGHTTDSRLHGGLEADLGAWGLLNLKAGYRSRDNPYILGYTPLLPESQQQNRIEADTGNADLTLAKEISLAGQRHKLQAGADYYDTDYVSTRLSTNRRENGDVQSLGVFITDRWEFSEPLTLQLGYRYHMFDGQFRRDRRRRVDGVRTWVPGEPYDRDWNRSAADLGLTYALKPDTTLFGSYATSFRFPNVDEFAQSDEDLRPQEGRHLDVGIRQKIRGWCELSLTLFEMRIEDEIFYDASTVTNRNFDERTRRRGVELDFKIYPAEAVYVWGNYTFMDARFEGRDTVVPLVPRHQAAVGLEWQILESLGLSMTGTYVGSRFDGNDENNTTYRKLDPYTVFDAKLSYQKERWKLFFAVNNILNELYSTLAFSETYYPMPTRNYYGGAEWRF